MRQCTIVSPSHISAVPTKAYGHPPLFKDLKPNFVSYAGCSYKLYHSVYHFYEVLVEGRVASPILLDPF